VKTKEQLRLLIAEESPANDLMWGWGRAGWVARSVRGKKMRTTDGLFDEFAAALQFPWYFGENWDAFDECLADMDSWLLPTAGIAVLVYDAAQVLVDEPAEQLEIAVKVFATAMAELAVSGPFRIVLQAEPSAETVVRRRWAAAGADLVPFVTLDR